MFDTLCDLVPRDRDLSARARTLDILRRVLDGTIYDVLQYQFHEERTPGGEYVPLRARRPSVRYGLCRVVVEDSVALLFSEGHFPTVACADRVLAGRIGDLIKETCLNQVMIEAAIRGSVGSIAILMRVLRGRVFFSVLDTAYLLPEWDREAPDALIAVTERYKVSGRHLAESGYDIADPGAVYWFMRRWDDEEETWYVPSIVGTECAPVVDEARSVRHALGFVPLVWVRNLPWPSATGSPLDGACTFRSAVETSIEIDYQLSQAGRGLKYSSDPTLIIKEPASSDGELIKGGGNALVLSEKGDAKLLEIGGTASAAVIEYVRTLREFALESVHGSRVNPDRLTAAQSGRALEMLNQGLIWLADNLRVSYGEGALVALVRMVLRAAQVYRLNILGTELERPDPGARITLKWPRWYPLTAEDRLRDAQTLAALVANGTISRETALQAVADGYDIEDIEAERSRVTDDRRNNRNP